MSDQAGDQQADGQHLIEQRSRRPCADETEFFFLNTAYLNAYIQILKSVRQHGGLFLLTGEPGVGKTFLLRKLESAAPDNIKFISLFSGDLDYENLIKTLCERLGIGEIEPRPAGENTALKDYVKREDAERRSSVALLIDDAHKLGERGLAHLIALFDWSLPDRQAPRIVLGGAPELEAMVARIGADQLIAARRLHVRLEPLAENDVATYISRQLNAGATPEMNPLFSRWAIQKITRLTGGIPHLIDTLCQRALAIARLKGKTTVSMLAIDQAAKEMMLEAEENTAEGVTVIPWAKHYVPDAPEPADLEAEPGGSAPVLIGEEPDAIIVAAASDEKPVERLDGKGDGFALDDSADYPVTTVSFAKADPNDSQEVMYSLAPTGGDLHRRQEAATYQALERLMEDDLLVNATMSVQWDERYAQQAPPKARSSPTVQFITLIFVSILAGIAGGIGSYYLFDSKPVQISVVAPAGTSLAVGTKPAVENGRTARVEPVEPVKSSLTAANEPERASRPAVAPAVTTAALPLGGRLPVTAPVAVATPLIASYMSRGDALMARGDVASARSFYLEAADAGFPAAMAAVGKTYDPLVLSGLRIKGLSPDPVKAIEWYTRAQQAGSVESAQPLEAIRQLMADGSYPMRATAVQEPER